MTTIKDYNAMSSEEVLLWKLFLELKTKYHTLRLSRPSPALEESIKTFARELAEEHVHR